LENVYNELIVEQYKKGDIKQKQALAEEREKHLLEKHKDASGIYFMKHMFKNVLKFGSSSNVTNRIKKHKTDFGKENIYLDKVIETDKYVQLENCVREHQNDTLEDSNGHNHTEIIRYESENEISNIYTNIDNRMKLVKPPQYSLELELEKEKTKQEEIRKQVDIEREKTKQLELQLEILKLQQRPQAVQVNESQTLSSNIFEKFLIETTEFTDNTNNRISVSKIYERFKEWVSEHNLEVEIPKQYRFMSQLNRVDNPNIIYVKGY
jgi:hypothetical protein